MNECVETKKCRAAPDLPEKFRELGVPENVAIFFEVAGKAPQDLLNTIRRHSFYKNSIHYEAGKCFLAEDYGNPLDFYTEISTGLEKCYVAQLHYSDTWSGYSAGSALRINFTEVATPYLSRWIRQDAPELFEKLCNILAEGVFMYEGHTYSTYRRIILEYCLEHYEEMEKIEVNEGVVEESLLKFLREGCGRSPSYYEPGIISKKVETYRRSRKKGEFGFLENGIYEGDFIGPNIADYTCTQECYDAIKAALYIEET